nr:major capsid protein [Paracoccus sp. IB05]
MDSLTLSLEVEQAKLATDPANYGAGNKPALVTDDCWNKPNSDPLGDIETAKEKLRCTCGVDPNRMAISGAGFRALKHHPKIAERFKYTTAESVTAKMLAGLFELEELAVGKAVFADPLSYSPMFGQHSG